MSEDFFWNKTGGVRPFEPVPGLFAQICEDMGHVHDTYYGPLVCARCGHRDSPAKRRRWRALRWGRR